MLIYKFRKLTSDEDYERLRVIIETGHFWCSSFWELNDPMEGVFCTDHKSIVDSIFDKKSGYKICSFSGEAGFAHPAMWGYYAGGFKGVAIQVEVELKNGKCGETGGVKKIKPENILPEAHDVEKILLNKSEKWEHENEFRFLIKSENNYHSIGKIIAVYFGYPYGNITNKQHVKDQSKVFDQYEIFKDKVLKEAKGKSIPSFNVVIKNGEVKKCTQKL